MQDIKIHKNLQHWLTMAAHRVRRVWKSCLHAVDLNIQSKAWSPLQCSVWVHIRKPKGLQWKAGGSGLEAVKSAFGGRKWCPSKGEDWSSSLETDMTLPTLLSFHISLVAIFPRLGLPHPELCWTNVAGYYLSKFVQSLVYHITNPKNNFPSLLVVILMIITM